MLRSIAVAVLQLLMETDVDGLIGAGGHERNASARPGETGIEAAIDRVFEGEAQSRSGASATAARAEAPRSLDAQRLEYCIDLGWRSDNPAKGVSLLKVQTDPRLPWPPSLITAFRKAAPLGTRERLIMELCLGTGQQIGDVLKMRWSDIEGGGILVKQSKTGKHLWVPIVPALQEALDAATRQAIYILKRPAGNLNRLDSLEA